MRFYLLFFFCSFFSEPILFAQLNQSDDSGQRQGMWRIEDSKGEYLLAEGRYEAGQRHGVWKFYFSPVARYTKTADITGSYEYGQKQGIWKFTEPKSKTELKGRFEGDKMTGVWSYTDRYGNALAKGYFDEENLRSGEWLIYRENQEMARGFYERGQKDGEWVYDYYINNGKVRVKANFNYKNGLRDGRVESFKIENHPKFERQELLVGVGTFEDGRKTGRWIEYDRGLRGETIETGYYDGEGRKLGLWETMLDGKSYQECAYNDGKLNGVFRSFYTSGELRYQTAYERGLEHGLFASYYEDGTLREKGAYTVVQQEAQEGGDTIYHKIELPMEFVFRLIDQDYGNINTSAVAWQTAAELSIPGEELLKRYEELLSYAKQGNLRVKSIERKTHKSVRVGKYQSYHPNGKVKLEGQYYPATYYGKNANGSLVKDFAKDGIWKEYDDLGYLRKTYTYNKGKLTKMVDDKDNVTEYD